jgi:hypothetical protein
MKLKVIYVALQAGGALAFSGITLLATFALIQFFSHVSDGGLIALALLPFTAVAVAAVLAGILFFVCRKQQWGFKQTATTWIWATVYGFVLLIIEWSAFTHINVSNPVSMVVILMQTLIGLVLIFLVTSGGD